jgi:hypothetical protein
MLRGGGITAREAKRQREQTAREWDRERRAQARAEGPGLCVDLSWHPYHCGACNRACGMVCTGGECL